jgi:iron complex outermembrane receptor protein
MRVPATIALAVIASPALAQEAPPSTDTSFGLGQIIVVAPRAEGVAVGAESLGQEAIYTFNRQSLDDAASLIPGVTAGNSGGSRNERLLFVRGFDRFQVPVSIDGIRVYLPADNRLDYGRFLTPDIAEIQVAKGYASVLDGPGALGGAVNLVTRKPTKAIEAEARAQINLDRDANYGGYSAFALLGTRQDRWYAQASYARNFTDHWDLPGGFEPTTNENGDARDFSRTSDWRVNVKAGFTPNATDEYALSYTRQEGRRNAPLHITDPITTQRNWSWPYWNIDSLYFLSTTALGEAATLKTRAYRNSFDNLLRAFDNRAQDSQTLGRAFNSYYEDEAWGGSAELDVKPLPNDRLSLAVHFRSDRHVEYQQSFPAGITEPRQTNLENTWSVALENVLDLTPHLVLTTGASYDWRDLKRAEEFGTPPGGGAAALFSYPIRNAGAWNAQGRIEYLVDDGTRVHASVSSRARFPTIFERFSTQFGTAASNPALRAERATNVELGGTLAVGPLTLTAAGFYSKVDDAIVGVRPATFPAGTTQRRNLGEAEYYGGEIGVTARVGSTLDLGANYTHIERDFSITLQTGVVIPSFALTDVPDDKGFAYASWRPLTGLEITPSVEVASNRTTLTTTAPAIYYRTGSYVRADLRIDYAVLPEVTLGVGARNLFDDYYVLTDGFPEPGRSLFASLRARY